MSFKDRKWNTSYSRVESLYRFNKKAPGWSKLAVSKMTRKTVKVQSPMTPRYLTPKFVSNFSSTPT